MSDTVADKSTAWQMPPHSRKYPFYYLCILSSKILSKVVMEGPQMGVGTNPQGKWSQLLWEITASFKNLFLIGLYFKMIVILFSYNVKWSMSNFQILKLPPSSKKLKLEVTTCWVLNSYNFKTLIQCEILSLLSHIRKISEYFQTHNVELHFGECC